MRRLAVLALVAVVVLVGCRELRTPARTPAPSPSPSPTEVAATATPSASASPSPSPTPSVRARFGIVVFDGDPSAIRLRLEDEAEPFAKLDGSLATISPDGRRLAYWHREPGSNGLQDDLRILDLFNAGQSQVTRLQNERPAGVAWRDDAGGLVFASTSPNLAFAGIDPPPAFTVVRLVSFVDNRVRELKRIDAARFFPLGWNLGAKVVFGMNAGEGGVRAIFRFNEDGTSAGESPPERRFAEVDDVTRDDTAILGQFAYGEGGKIFSGVRKVGATAPTPLAEREAAGGAYLIRARFRPATADIVVLLRAPDTSKYVLEIWSGPALQGTKRLWTGPAAPASGDLITRVDGKAVYVRTDEAGSAKSAWQVVDLDTGAALQLATSATGSPGGPSFLVTDDAIAKLRRP